MNMRTFHNPLFIISLFCSSIATTSCSSHNNEFELPAVNENFIASCTLEIITTYPKSGLFETCKVRNADGSFSVTQREVILPQSTLVRPKREI